VPLVQSAGNTATSGTTVAVTLSPTGPGNCLVVCAGVEAGSALTVSGITLGGSAGNFARAESQTDNYSSDLDCEAWTDQNCAGGQTSVTVTFSGTVGAAFAQVMEWGGIAASSAVDKAAGASGGATGTSLAYSASSGTLGTPGELVVGAVIAGSLGSAGITGPGSPWTNLAQLASGFYSFRSGYQVVPGTGSQAYAGTISGSNFEYYAAVIISLKMAVASAPSPLLIPPGISSPMNWQRQSWPVPGPLVVLGSDTGSGADAVTGSGQVGSPGYPLIPPGFGSPMAWQRRSASIPASLPTVSSSDTGTGAEGVTVQVAAADTGTGADAGLISQEADTGTGTEAGTVTATVSAADAGTGADSGGIGGVQAGDTGTGAESGGSVTVRELQMVRWSASDKLSKSGGTMG
jgi:hypothetical protein